MGLKSKKLLKLELKRVRTRQNPHVFNNKEHKRKLKLRKTFWHRFKIKRSEL